MVARKRKLPEVFSVPPITSAPTPLVTGRGSPEIMDSSIWLSPSTISPSTAIFSPGRTSTMSPTRTASTLTSTASPLRSMRAVLAC
ncbi:hypothetical protein D3C87_1915800 [compost metagenome]